MPKDRFMLKRGQTIVFEGDSLTGRRSPPSLDTWPYLELMNWKRTYADEVARLLFCWRPDLRLTFHHAAVGGSSCREVDARWEKMVRPHNPAWIVMTLGGNDMNRKIPIADFEGTLDRYAARAKAACGTRMALLGGFISGPHLPKEKARTYAKRKAYYEALRRVARKHGGIYIDAGRRLHAAAVELYKQCPIHSVYSDGGHFNEAGSVIVAAQVLKALGFEF